MANQNDKIKNIDNFRARLDDAVDAYHYVDSARTFYHIEVRSDIRAEVTIGSNNFTLNGLDVVKSYDADNLDDLNACRRIARHEMIMNDHLFFDVFYIQTTDVFGDKHTIVTHIEREYNDTIDLNSYKYDYEDDTEIEEPCYFEREY